MFCKGNGKGRRETKEACWRFRYDSDVLPPGAMVSNDPRWFYRGLPVDRIVTDHGAVEYVVREAGEGEDSEPMPAVMCLLTVLPLPIARTVLVSVLL